MRKEKILKMREEEEDQTADATAQEILLPKVPATKQPTLLDKIKDSAQNAISKNRQKRSEAYQQVRQNGWGMAFAKKRITWRLVR